MEREIQFEDLPEQMQNDWCKYIDTSNVQSIRILGIRMLMLDVIKSVRYVIYYDFANITGVASYSIYEDGTTIGTMFDRMIIGDVKELLKLSDKLR